MAENKLICINCGEDLDFGAKFCASCGTKVETNIENVCNNCGTVNPENSKFCTECGSNLNTPKFEGYINQKSATQRKGLVQKLFEDTGKALENAKEEISKSINDYTNAAETETIETYNTLIVKVELPYIKKDDIDVDITPRKVNIKAFFDQNITTEQGHDITRNNRQQGQITKTIRLPKQVVPEKAEAEFKNHYLILELPKAEIEKSHRIKL